MTVAEAEALVEEKLAEWSGPKLILLNGHGLSFAPEFHELRADTARWVGRGKHGPRLTEIKQDFLHALKRLS